MGNLDFLLMAHFSGLFVYFGPTLLINDTHFLYIYFFFFYVKVPLNIVVHF